MQNRYAGDVGDFGKLGMLRCIEKCGLSIGINWYLVKDEEHNNDGKYTSYIKDRKYDGCDDELLILLNKMMEQNSRTVLNIEKLQLFERGSYYHEILHEPKEQAASRSSWHQKALYTMKDCDLVFLDPDNGLLPKSISPGSKKSIKYVFQDEIIDYYKAGHSVIFYSHRTREPQNVYLERFTKLFNAKELENATIRGLSFRRGTIRDYFFIIHNEHISRIEESLSTMLAGKWQQHFCMIDRLNKNDI